MNGISVTHKPAAGKLRLFSPDSDLDEKKVDWPATIPFVRPEKVRRNARPEAGTPKLRIFNG